jgi:hypothetical protein
MAEANRLGGMETEDVWALIQATETVLEKHGMEACIPSWDDTAEQDNVPCQLAGECENPHCPCLRSGPKKGGGVADGGFSEHPESVS